MFGGTCRQYAVVTTFLVAVSGASCDRPTATTEISGISYAVVTAITGMRGTGGIGDGLPTSVGKNRQWFDLDVSATGLAQARLEYIDSAFLKEDGRYPHLVVGATWPGTGVLSFIQTSETCAEFHGVGRLVNTDELLVFRAQACDNRDPGVGFDEFGIEVPQRLVTHGAIYRSGPASLWYGELTRSGTTVPLPLLP